MKKFNIIFLMITLSFICCGTLEMGSGDSYGVNDIPGTIKVKLPITWDIGKSGGTWRSTYNIELRSYNPFASLEGTAYEVLYSIFDGLFEYDLDTREWNGYQVKEFKVVTDKTNDKMELICELRDDIYWHDGKQMTAYDVYFYYTKLEWNEKINPRGYNSNKIKMKDGSTQPITIEQIDEFKFKFIFPRIVANPILQINGFVLPGHIWKPVYEKGIDAIMEFWGINTPEEKIIGNGAFILEEYRAAERLIYKKNKKYWKKDEKGNQLPYRDRIVNIYIPPGNNTAELLKFQKGEIESYSLRGKDMATLLPESEKKSFNIWNGGASFRYGLVVFNQNPLKLEPYKHKLFNKKEFRHAISCLVDRESIINEVINGFGEPYYHFIAENNKFFNNKYATEFKFNPEKGVEKLKSIGLADSNNDGFLEDSEGNTISFKMMTYGNDQVIIDILNLMIDQFTKAGLKVNLEVVDYNVWAEKLQYTYDWECTMLGFSFPTFPEQYSNQWPSSGDRHLWYPKQKNQLRNGKLKLIPFLKRLFTPMNIMK
jgi:peptide/nickel transport system substrate-binding protein